MFKVIMSVPYVGAYILCALARRAVKKDDVRLGLYLWDQAAKWADNHEPEMWAAQRENRFYVGWGYILETNLALEVLAERRMTTEHRQLAALHRWDPPTMH